MYTREEWRAVRLRLFKRAKQVSKYLPHLMYRRFARESYANELTSRAIAKALAPETKPWDEERFRTFEDYLCDLVWSEHGNQQKSYRNVMASAPLTDEMLDRAVAAPGTPLTLLLGAHDEAIATRRRAELDARVRGDALIELLLAASDDGEDGDDPPGPGGDAGEMEAPADELVALGMKPRAAAPTAGVARRSAQPASTRAALAEGYTLKDIKNARERLKRHAEAIVQEETEVKS